MSKIWAERLTAAGMILVAGFFLAQSTTMPSTSGTFPQFTEYMVMLLAAVMIVRTFITPNDRKLQGEVRFDFSYAAVKPVYVMIVTIVYAYLIFQIGFYVTSIVFFFLVTWMTGFRNLKIMAAVAVVLFPIMFAFFNILLGADLPEGILI